MAEKDVTPKEAQPTNLSGSGLKLEAHQLKLLSEASILAPPDNALAAFFRDKHNPRDFVRNNQFVQSDQNGQLCFDFSLTNDIYSPTARKKADERLDAAAAAKMA